MSKIEFEPMDRRRFMQTTALAAGAAVLSSYAEEAKSRLIEVHRPGIIQENNRPDAKGVQEMLDRALQELTGEKSRKDQWAKFVKADDVVGLKANGLGGPNMCTKHELVKAVIQGLLEVGVQENHIIVWDNNDGHIKAIGMGINTGKTGVRIYSSEFSDFDAEKTVFGSGNTHLSKILTEQITVMINMPIIKDHTIAGTTLSLKNISHGITNNPGSHHANGCDPYIAEINALPVVKQKHRLIIMDGLRGCCDGGPSFKLAGAVNYESILVSTDRLAMDVICTEKIEAARKQKGLDALEKVGRPTKYLATAEKMGLGQRNKEKIDYKVV